MQSHNLRVTLRHYFKTPQTLAAVNWKANYSSPVKLHWEMNGISSAVELSLWAGVWNGLKRGGECVSKSHHRDFVEFWEKSRSTIGQLLRWTVVAFPVDRCRYLRRVGSWLKSCWTTGGRSVAAGRKSLRLSVNFIRRAVLSRVYRSTAGVLVVTL